MENDAEDKSFMFRIIDKNGNVTRLDDGEGYWSNKEYDDDGVLIFFENSNGDIYDNRPKK